jgi:hypothetical protein
LFHSESEKDKQAEQGETCLLQSFSLLFYKYGFEREKVACRRQLEHGLRKNILVYFFDCQPYGNHSK